MAMDLLQVRVDYSVSPLWIGQKNQLRRLDKAFPGSHIGNQRAGVCYRFPEKDFGLLSRLP